MHSAFFYVADIGAMVTAHQQNTLKQLAELRELHPVTPSRTSLGLGWKAIQAVRWGDTPDRGEVTLPPLFVHAICLMIRPPQKLCMRYEGVRVESPLPAGSIWVGPAGTSTSRLVRWEGNMDTLGIYIDPSLIAQVAKESFDFDPTRTLIPPLHSLTVPELRAAMLAVDAELRINSVGSPLLVESLAITLSVHLLRHINGCHRLPTARDGILSRRKLRKVVDYIMENLEGSPTLRQMAAIANLSPYHFARQFKAATGLPPYHYVIARRVERAQDLLRTGLVLADVALRAGFSDQSQFSFHFKRLVGVTPRQFRLATNTHLIEMHE
jgi:AraC family transcriptional regulator